MDLIDAGDKLNDQVATTKNKQPGPRAWNIWLNIDGIDLTFWYLIREYKMLVGAYDPTFRFAGAQARAKAILLRDIIRKGGRDSFILRGVNQTSSF